MRVNKLFILVGESGCGKSTLEREIANKGLAKRAISTTTRKPRSYEVDMVDYYFINEVAFNTYLKQGAFAECSQYTTVNGLASYGIMKGHLNLKDNKYICVVNPHGMRQLKESLGEENVVTIHVKRDDRSRVISALQRDNSDFGKVLDETTRRFKADQIDFKNIDEEVDYILYNNGSLEESLNILESLIKSC